MSTNASAVEANMNEEVLNWGIDEVSIWCAQKLALDGGRRDKFQANLKEHGIDGQVLLDLELEDCKQLTDNDSSLAVQLKLEVNRLRAQKQTQEDEILAVLTQLYSTVSEKLQDFQSQYARLRLDVLEVVKKDPHASFPPIQLNTQHQQPQHDYFEGQKIVTPGSSNNTFVRQAPARSHSNSTSQQTLGIGGSTTSTPGVAPQQTPSGGSGTEPLKHMRASKEDSCERVLKSAMKRHNLSEQDWRQYVLVICYGDQERILELDEKPVLMFKNLKQQGLHPAIMLRQRGDFEEVGGGLTPGGRL
ncbi:Ste50p [Lachancea thermotolerans CBS 6340]|uniref:KLTH0F01364p n=1 Tax=Lachancea thermotolerans (strain ATCC 56472 / CBS 6340 / NRRL Y-8284) TaxID=559295 RepID=C5DK31_LACTC|nr:KLTH0F01364p [Lachancea thermotolerans CBS 6340]CAR23832.1 KLTH0F01364p [Lachancea thermotolerans CBS 6340]